MLAGMHVGCFELFGRRRHSQHRRSEGQDRRRRRVRRAAITLFDADGGPCRPRPRARTSIGSPIRTPSRRTCSSTARSTPSSASRPSPRNCAPGISVTSSVNTTVDRPWSQYFCCMLGGQSGIRPQTSGRNQAGAARNPQGHRSLRHRPGARRAAARRWRLRRRAMTSAADAERGPVRQMARLRCRGHDALLCAADARSWASSSRPRRRSSPTAPIGDFSNELKRELKA